MNNLGTDVGEFTAGRPPTACPFCVLTEVGVRAIYALPIDRLNTWTLCFAQPLRSRKPTKNWQKLRGTISRMPSKNYALRYLARKRQTLNLVRSAGAGRMFSTAPSLRSVRVIHVPFF